MTYDLSSAETLEREIKAFDFAADKIPIEQAIFLTYNTFDTLKTKKLNVSVLPVWWWILDKNSEK